MPVEKLLCVETMIQLWTAWLRRSSHSKPYIRHHIILQTAAKFLSRLDVKLYRQRPIAAAIHG